MSPEELLGATLEKARQVPIGGRVDTSEVAQKAIESARLEARVRRARRGRFLMGAAAAVVVLALGLGAWNAIDGSMSEARETVALGPPDEAPPVQERTAGPDLVGAGGGSSAEPSRLRLDSGDWLVSSPGVDFDVLSEARDRVVRLNEGEMLFDVAHQPSGSFVVRASDVSVRVLGTVFSVRREGEAIGVRVFDGAVRVRGADGAELQRLVAGDLWVSGTLEGMEEWAARSEREWRRIAREGRVGRAAPARAAGGLDTRTDVRRGSAAGAGEELHPNERAPSPPSPTLARARALIARGDFEAALHMSEGHTAEGVWLLLRADALRGLGRTQQAARAYEAAAGLLEGSRRVGAAFAAAQLHAETAPEVATRLLERFGVTRESSPLEERGRALRIELLYRLGRTEEGDTEALAYEERFGRRR